MSILAKLITESYEPHDKFTHDKLKSAGYLGPFKTIRGDIHADHYKLTKTRRVD